MAKPQLVLFGIDGGTFDLIEPLAQGGHLPTLARLLEVGARCRLRSTVPPLTACAWSTFMTGVQPGRHGIYDFCALEPGGYATPFINGSYLKTTTIWQRLNGAGKTVGLLAVPFTYPPPAVDGFAVAGMDAPLFDASVTHPRELYQEIVTHVGSYSYRAIPRTGELYDVPGVEAQVDRLFDIAEHLLAAHPVDVFAMVANTVDHLQHFFWRDRAVRSGDGRTIDDIIAHGYQHLDRRLGQLLSRLPGDSTVLVISDHGAAPIRRHFNLEQWLHDEGFLAYRRFSPFRRAAMAGKMALKRILPRRARDRLAAMAPGARNRVRQASIRGHIDWSRTGAFPWGSSGYVQLNLRGREPQGRAEPGEEAEQLRHRIRDRLLALRDPETGQPVIESVCTAEELYGAGPVGNPPDLVAVPFEGRYDFFKPARPNMPIFLSPGTPHAGAVGTAKTGAHHPDGIFIAAGPHIVPGAYPLAGLVDIAPTVFALLGLPVPSDMDGEALTHLIEGTPVDADLGDQAEAGGDNPAPYTPDQAAAVEKRLRELGYL